MALLRRTPLKPGKPLARRTPLRAVSLKRAALAKTKRSAKTGPDRTTRDLVFDRDTGCLICGAGPYGLQVHHRKPRRLGGRSGQVINQPSNLILVCGGCHARIESERAWALDLGLLLHEAEDPAEIPVLHRLYGIAYLLDDGSVRPITGEDGAP